jgi:hypothetical protein
MLNPQWLLSTKTKFEIKRDYADKEYPALHSPTCHLGCAALVLQFSLLAAARLNWLGALLAHGALGFVIGSQIESD